MEARLPSAGARSSASRDPCHQHEDHECDDKRPPEVHERASSDVQDATAAVVPDVRDGPQDQETRSPEVKEHGETVVEFLQSADRYASFRVVPLAGHQMFMDNPSAFNGVLTLAVRDWDISTAKSTTNHEAGVGS
ncbi:hypothetical protein PRNP1_002545 [Phytophthora ramorum]